MPKENERIAKLEVHVSNLKSDVRFNTKLSWWILGLVVCMNLEKLPMIVDWFINKMAFAQ